MQSFLAVAHIPTGLFVFAAICAVLWMLGGGPLGAFGAFGVVNAKALRETRAAKLRPIAAQMRTMTDLVITEGRKFTTEEQGKFDELDKQSRSICEEFDPQITALSRSEELDASLGAPAGEPDVGRDDSDGRNQPLPDEQRTNPHQNEERFALAFQGWMRANSSRGDDLTDQQMRACKTLNINPRAKQFVIRPLATRDFRRAQSAFRNGTGHMGAEERALSSLSIAAGGATIPPGALQQLEINMLAYGGVLQAAETIRTESGEPFPWPTANDTGNTGRQIGENLATTSTAEPSFAQQIWSAYQFTSDEVLVPYMLMEDSAFDLASIIFGMLGERIGRILNTKFTTGSGAGTPKGIVTAAAAGITAASQTAIAWDEITSLIHSIDPAYRQTGCGFMFHDNTMLKLRQLKDGMGRPLWQDGPNGTPPPTLQGFPYFINQDMASSIATTAVTMLFGQLSKYKVRQVREIRMYRLVERHRENDQDAFLAFIRADGNLLNAGTAPVKKLTQA